MRIIVGMQIISFLLIASINIYKLNLLFEPRFNKVINSAILFISLFLVMIGLNIYVNSFISYYFLLVFLFPCVVLLFFKGNKYLIVLLNNITMLIIINSQSIILSLSIIFRKTSLYKLYLYDKLNLLTTITLVIIISAELFITIFIKMKFSLEYCPKKSSLLIMNITLFSKVIVNLLLLFYLFYSKLYIEFAKFVLLFTIVGIGTDFYIIWLSIKNNKAEDREKELTILNEQVKYQYEHYKDLEAYYKDVRRIWHDINNHKNVISVLIENRQYVELENYMNDINDYLKELDKNMFISKNKIVEAICLNKAKLCREKNIDIEFNINIPEVLSIRDIDLCAIYGNVLDNGIEACERVESGREKKIKVESCVKDGYLSLFVVNTKELKKAVIGATSKEDRLKHGIGLESIKKSVSKYSGHLMLKDKWETFEVRVILKL